MKIKTLLIILIVLFNFLPLFAENTSLTGMKLSNASPEDRIRIRELLGEYKASKARSGPAYSHFIIGRVYSLTKQYDESRKTFQKIIDLYRHTKWASVARESIAETWVLEGKPEKALKEYDDYLDLYFAIDSTGSKVYYHEVGICNSTSINDYPSYLAEILDTSANEYGEIYIAEDGSGQLLMIHHNSQDVELGAYILATNFTL